MPHSPRSRKVRAIASRHGIPTHNAARRSSAASWSSTCIAEARMSITPKLLVVACALSCAVALSACGDRAATGAQQPGTQAQDEALPKPDQPGGSITGMSSRPGPGAVPLTGEPPPPLVAEPADQVDLLNPETGLLTGSATGPPGAPPPQDAVSRTTSAERRVGKGSVTTGRPWWSPSQ